MIKSLDHLSRRISSIKKNVISLLDDDYMNEYISSDGMYKDKNKTDSLQGFSRTRDKYWGTKQKRNQFYINKIT